MEGGPKETDLLLEDGLISDIGKIDYRIDDCQIVDAKGLDILPGFIDIHTHLDDVIGSLPLADTWSTGSQIALQNGITTLCGFITQRPGQSLEEALAQTLDKAQNRSFCDFAFHLTPTSFEQNDWRYIEKLLSDGFRTFKFYTTYRSAGLFLDYLRLRDAMQRLSEMEATALVHCEDESVLEGAMDGITDFSDPFGHARSRPPQAEIEAVIRILNIADKTRCHTHIVHVSTAKAAEIIFQAKGDVPVTCETCPQYLFLSDDRLKGKDGHRFICSPPLRDEQNRNQMLQLAQRGYFDILATDHCAFYKKDKDAQQEDFRKVPNGLPGIGALVPLVNELSNDPAFLSYHLALMPAKIAGIYPRKGVIRKKSDADLVLLNIQGRNRDIKSSLADVYEPYERMTTRLEVKIVFLRGEKVIEDGALYDLAFRGKRV